MIPAQIHERLHLACCEGTRSYNRLKGEVRRAPVSKERQLEGSTAASERVFARETRRERGWGTSLCRAVGRPETLQERHGLGAPHAHRGAGFPPSTA